MIDKRIEQVAQNIVNYSVNIQKGDVVRIALLGYDGIALAREVFRLCVLKGAIPALKISDEEIDRYWVESASEKQMLKMAEITEDSLKKINKSITICAYANSFNSSTVPVEKKMLNAKIMTPLSRKYILPNPWTLLIYPTPAMAQKSMMPTRDFEDLYFKVCTLDYSKMEKASRPLKELMERTDKVRIVSPENDTDISFSIKGINVVPCCGNFNIPDGEVFTAPVKNSINGRVKFNCEREYSGKLLKNVALEFKDGKIVNATADNQDAIDYIINTDEGARYIGEFALGINPFLTDGIGDLLFDEKITGSFHFAIGKCYDDADNGNKSVHHCDLVQIQTKKYGGGEIYFDDVLIRKDGIFVLDELKGLNPENLK